MGCFISLLISTSASKSKKIKEADVAPATVAKPDPGPIVAKPHVPSLGPGHIDPTTQTRDIDEFGCCLNCGEFWCPDQKACVSDPLACNVGKYDPDACTFKYTAATDEVQFTYDLSQLTLSDPNLFYTFSDRLQHRGEVFSYYFNVCRNIPLGKGLLPKACEDSTTGSALEDCTNEAYAYQYFETSWNYTSCYRLSSCFKDGPEVELGLIDPMKPAEGVFIKYTGGNTCANSYADKRKCTTLGNANEPEKTYCARSFKLNVYCHDEVLTECLVDLIDKAFFSNIFEILVYY